MRIYIFLILLKFSISFINKIPSLLGTWVLRSTNDNKFVVNYTFLTLTENNSIKLKTIFLDGIVSTKISRYGELKLKKKNNINYFNFNIFNDNNNLNIMKETNNVNIQLKFNKLSKYSYSIFGIEIPKVKYTQFTNYNINKNINVKPYDKTIFIIDLDTKLFYLFDLNYNGENLPYTGLTLNTLLITQLISFIVNLALVNLVKVDEDIINKIFK